jgi:hypothetical protein
VKRLTTPLCLAALLTAMLATPALAAPPSNDTYAGRISIGTIPFSTTLDTSEATTDAVDVEINVCGAPAMDASVWYELTGAAGPILVDVSGSDYSAGVFVATGGPGAFDVVACGPGAVAFDAAPSETYAIVAIDDQQDGGGNGGMLSLELDVAPPPPTVDLTVDPVAQFNSQTGGATVTGTVTCSGGDSGFIDLQLQQRVGRFLVRGFGFTEFVCDGTTQAWSAEVFADTGLFKGGRAASVVFAVSCNAFACTEDVEEVTIKLRG